MRDEEILASHAKDGASEWYSKLLFNIAGADGVLDRLERQWIIGNRAAFGKIYCSNLSFDIQS